MQMHDATARTSSRESDRPRKDPTGWFVQSKKEHDDGKDRSKNACTCQHVYMCLCGSRKFLERARNESGGNREGKYSLDIIVINPYTSVETRIITAKTTQMFVGETSQKLVRMHVKIDMVCTIEQ